MALLTPDTADFDTKVWARVFNRRPLRQHQHQQEHDPYTPGRQPSAISAPRSRDDVVAAVQEARKRGLRIAVRSGGHSWAGWSVRGESLLLDLRALSVGEEQWGREHMSVETKEIGGAVDASAVENDIIYDAATGVVSCGPAVRSGELNAVLARHGRFFAGGHHPDVGLGGFLLQGGMGWNTRGWGWACESVVGVDVVTTSGEVREVRQGDGDEEGWLWMARGAGPGFPGVVTRFYLQTRELRGLWQSLYLFEGEGATDVLEWVIRASATADPDVEIVCVAMYPAAGASGERLCILANFLAFKDSEDAARTALEPLEEGMPPPEKATPVSSVFCQSTTLTEQYAMQRAANPEGHRHYCDNIYVKNDFSSTETTEAAEAKDSSRAIAELIAPAFITLPTPKSAALYFAMAPGSSARRQSRKPMALSMESDHFVSLYSVWPDADGVDDERCPAWVSGNVRAWQDRGAIEGSYLGDADFRARWGTYWGKEEGGRVKREMEEKGGVVGFLGGEGDKFWEAY